jgi:hypothetical protein
MSPPELRVMAGELGDIFWDLPSWITYSPGFDLGCTIYVANHTEEEKEYALMGRLIRDDTLISEEALPVYGYAWFKVTPGDFIRLYGALRFDETDVDLTVSLIERETEQVADSVSTRLVAPAAAGALPPTWPGAPGAPGAGFDWSSMLMPVVMTALMGMVVVSAVRPAKEKEEVRLPPGRE